MRFSADDELAPLEIELLELDRGDASEVSFGGRSPRVRAGGRRWGTVATGVAVLAVIVGTTLLVRDDDDRAATPSTQAGGPSTTAAVVPVPTIFDRPTTTTATAATFVYDAPDAFATDPGWRIYLGTPSFLQAFDPAAGTLVDVEAPDDLYLVTAGAQGPAFLTRDDGGNEIVVPVGDGTGWTLGRGGSITRVELIDRTPVESVELPAASGSQQFGPLLLGTDGEGRPIVVLDDFRTYVVDEDGSLTSFADGAIVTSITSGRYLSTDCRDQGICVSALYSGDDRVVVDLDVQQLAFSVAGTHAVVFGSGPRGGVYRVVDLRDGTTLFEWIDVDSSFTFYGFNTPLPGWSPDGRFFFVTVDGALQVFDTSTNSVLRLVSDLPRGTVVRGVV